MSRRKPKGKVHYILNLFMVLMYAMVGVTMIFWHMPSLPTMNRYIIAGVLLIYSGYRGIVLYRKFKAPIAEE